MVKLDELTRLREDVRTLHQNLAEGAAGEMRVDELRRRCVSMLARSRDSDYEAPVRNLIQLIDSAYCQLQYHRQLDMHDRMSGRDAA